MKQIKMPREVLELFYEAEACTELAEHYGASFWPSLKAVVYASKSVKAKRLAWRALSVAHPEVLKGTWLVDTVTGRAAEEVEIKPVAEKKPRKPRKSKAEVTAPTKTEGEAQ